jgi:polyvinyl alcohol dehydrogenase (cytochrome)
LWTVAADGFIVQFVNTVSAGGRKIGMVSMANNRAPGRTAVLAVHSAAFALACLVDAAPLDAEDDPGAALYQRHCAACHEGGVAEAPSRAALERLSIDAVYAALTDGIMQSQAAALSDTERQQLASALGQRRHGAANTVVNACDTTVAGESKASLSWQGWGADAGNTRSVDGRFSSINVSNVDALELSWVFAIPDGSRPRSQPGIDSHRVYLGSQSGIVYALDRYSGCEYWRFEAAAEVRTAISVVAPREGEGSSLVFADMDAQVYALDADSGEIRWRVSAGDHPAATITGSPKVHDGRVFVPLSSSEVLSAVDPAYPCCSFRGGVVALDLSSGRELWRTHTVAQPQNVGKSRNGATARWAPSGAPVWNSPTIDVDRELLYVGTGENYSRPASDTSDAIIALSLDDGEIAWVHQARAEDAWNVACLVEDRRDNCPDPPGPDFDFGAQPILLHTPGGEDVLVAGQKSGDVYALDPARDGRLLWHKKLGHGGFNGGVHWGLTGGVGVVYVPISDSPHNEHSDKAPLRPGLTALNLEDGSQRWQHRLSITACDEHDYRCYPSLSAAPTRVNDLVFAGGLDGFLQAFSADTGELLWRFDTVRPYDAVNLSEAVGGSIDSDGPVIDGDQLFINSGYDKFGEIPGNVLLVFRLAQEPELKEDGP